MPANTLLLTSSLLLIPTTILLLLLLLISSLLRHLQTLQSTQQHAILQTLNDARAISRSLGPILDRLVELEDQGRLWVELVPGGFDGGRDARARAERVSNFRRRARDNRAQARGHGEVASTGEP